MLLGKSNCFLAAHHNDAASICNLEFLSRETNVKATTVCLLSQYSLKKSWKKKTVYRRSIPACQWWICNPNAICDFKVNNNKNIKCPYTLYEILTPTKQYKKKLKKIFKSRSINRHEQELVLFFLINISNFPGKKSIYKSIQAIL